MVPFVKYVIPLTIVMGLFAAPPEISNDEVFDHIYSLIQEKNYFNAREVFRQKGATLQTAKRLYIAASLYNAFHDPAQSNAYIQELLQDHHDVLPDSLVMRIYRIEEDNHVKKFEYNAAKDATEKVLETFGGLLSETEIRDYENRLKLWTALENQPKQRVAISGETRLGIIKDAAGLDNLSVSAGADTLNFIFDTGANISTVPRSTAEKFDMRILPAAIQVGTITGSDVTAHLAVCEQFSIGGIDVFDAVFLVLEDDDLYFPQIGYRIYGILGFPVIGAFGEIQITQDGYFIVPSEESEFSYESNMAMDGLTPLLSIENMYFTFDTGADITLLYHSYYDAHREYIETNYEKTTVGFAGAGGQVESDAYVLDVTFDLFGDSITIRGVHVLPDEAHGRRHVYGNIGQDLIRQFDRMTINFNRMFIRFD